VTDSATFTTPETGDEDLGDLLLEVLPGDGSTIGNLSAREALSRAAERQISEEEYEAVKEKALTLGLVVKGRGRGGFIAGANTQQDLMVLISSLWHSHRSFLTV